MVQSITVADLYTRVLEKNRHVEDTFAFQFVRPIGTVAGEYVSFKKFLKSLFESQNFSARFRISQDFYNPYTLTYSILFQIWPRSYSTSSEIMFDENGVAFNLHQRPTLHDIMQKTRSASLRSSPKYADYSNYYNERRRR